MNSNYIDVINLSAENQEDNLIRGNVLIAMGLTPELFNE
jgi:hypothetical protein